MNYQALTQRQLLAGDLFLASGHSDVSAEAIVAQPQLVASNVAIVRAAQTGSGAPVGAVVQSFDPADPTSPAYSDLPLVSTVEARDQLLVDGIVFDNQEFVGLFAAPTAPGVGTIMREDYDSINDADITLDQVQLIGQAGNVGDEITIRFLNSSLTVIDTFDYTFGTSAPTQHTIPILPTTTIPDSGVIEVEVISGTFNWYYNGNAPSTGTEVLASYGPSATGSYKMSLQNTTSGGPSGTADLETAQVVGWDSEMVVSTVTGTNVSATVIESTDTLYVDVAIINSDPGDGGAPIVDPFDYQIRSVALDGTTTTLATGTYSSPIAVGSFVTIEDINIGTLATGVHTLQIFVDSDEDITEHSETNNTYQRTIGVGQYDDSSQFISGVVFDDDDSDGEMDGGEVGKEGITVWVDLDEDGVFDAGEPNDVTASDGSYSIGGIFPGTYHVRQELEAGIVEVLPGPDGGIDTDFEIELLYRDDSFTASQKSAFQAAADRWAEIIVGDLSDQVSAGIFVDDLVIEVYGESVDGPFGQLGSGGPREHRSGVGGLPIRGEFTVDTDDVDRLEADGELEELAQHEIAHALGFATLWDELGLVTGMATPNPLYVGADALAAYQDIFDNSETGIPLHNIGTAGDGSFGSHWQESLFGSEIMSPTLTGGSSPLSMVTTGAMSDLGYIVDLGASDDYSSPAGDPFVPPPTDPPPISEEAPANVHLITVGTAETVTDVNFSADFPTPVIFTVNTTDDLGDADLSDGVALDINGNTTLRAAIEQANFSTGEPVPDQIEFAIPGAGPHVITVSSALPTITDAVVIDGTTEPGYSSAPLIEIHGSDSIAQGLRVTNTGSVFAGLSLTGFTEEGLELVGGGSHMITESYLGVDVDGNADGNFYGIRVRNSQSNTFDGNVISGNNRAGVLLIGVSASGNVFINNMVGTNPAGDAALANATDGFTIYAPNNEIGRAGEGNLISGNARWGVFSTIAGRAGNIVRGNVIGLNAAGDAAIPNVAGITLNNGPNTIGGSESGQGNIISGNSAYGVSIPQNGADSNVVYGNMIGVDATGTIDLGNGLFGVRILGGKNNVVGGTAAGQGNVISGNNHTGVLLAFNGATGNQIVGNKIGTNAAGTAAIGNSKDGVRFVQNANGNVLENNVVSGNGLRGVVVDGASVVNNEILSNRIGVNDAGTAPLHNGLGGAIRIIAPDTIIDNNTISGPDYGVLAFRAESSGTVIKNNYFGTDASETVTSLGMTTAVHLSNGASGTEVSGNVIANNTNGIVLRNAGVDNFFTHNSIYDNTSIGIDLEADGATPNDLNDADTGSNRLMNTPVVSSAVLSGSSLTVNYSIDALTTNAKYPIQIEFFISDGAGQGKTLIGDTTATASGASSVTFPSTTGVSVGTKIVATATDDDGNSSEFSLEFTVS